MRPAPRLVPALLASVALAVPVSLVPAADAAVPRCFGLKATIVGNAKANKIVGTNKRDVIVAGDGNDVIRGRGGNDVICGGFGADTIMGGPGNDRLDGEEDAYRPDRFGRVFKKGDTLVGGAGDDYLDPGYDPRPTTPGAPVRPDTVSYASAPAGVTVALAQNPAPVAADGNDLLVTGGDLRFVGSAHADLISGSFHREWLLGRGGDDRLFGQGGADVLVGDSGDAPGNDMLNGGSGDDELVGTLGSDTFVGSSGADTMTSTSVLRQTFRGGGGSDTVAFPLPLESGTSVKGHGGENRLRLLAHPNPALKATLRVDMLKKKMAIRGLTPTTITGVVNDFRVVSLPGNAVTYYKGTNRSDIVTANPRFRALIYGRGGADVLTGSDRPDRLDGGPGFDIVRGKGGNDTCRRAEKRSSC